MEKAMETKAQKAALADVEKKTERLIDRVTGKDFYNSDEIMKYIVEIDKIIKEFELEDKLLNNLIESVYNGLMKKERYSEAASFAKKYGL